MNTYGGDTLCSPPSRPTPRGPWEQLAKQWPSSPSVTGQQPRYGPRALPTADDISRRVHSMQIDPTRAPRYRTASGGHQTANKPLPPLPPARTPSQVDHQRRYAGGNAREQPPLTSHVRMPSAPPNLVPQYRSTPMSHSPLRPVVEDPQRRQPDRLEYVRPHSTSPTKQQQGGGSRVRTLSQGDSLPAMPTPRAVSPRSDAELAQRPPPRVPSVAGPSSASTSTAQPSSEPPPYDLLFGPARTPPRPAPATRAEPPATPIRASAVVSAASTPSTPLSEPKAGQCWGIKRDGGRCTRTVAAEGSRQTPSPTKKRNARLASEPPPSRVRGAAASRPIIIDSDEDDEGDGTSTAPIYCHQHAKEINKSPGFHLPHSLSYIAFDEYIPSHLSATTSARLRTAMAEPLSASDRDSQGYIYIYELVSGDSSAPLRLKVGRSQRPMNRIAQWRSQCASKPTVLRRLYPEASASSSSLAQAPLIVGANHVSTQGLPGSHKWEKLIHLELSERYVRLSHSPCVDCGKVHREIFEISGSHASGFADVCAVVAKWERFVRLCVDDRESRR